MVGFFFHFRVLGFFSMHKNINQLVLAFPNIRLRRMLCHQERRWSQSVMSAMYTEGRFATNSFYLQDRTVASAEREARKAFRDGLYAQGHRSKRRELSGAFGGRTDIVVSLCRYA